MTIQTTLGTLHLYAADSPVRPALFGQARSFGANTDVSVFLLSPNSEHAAMLILVQYLVHHQVGTSIPCKQTRQLTLPPPWPQKGGETHIITCARARCTCGAGDSNPIAHSRCPPCKKQPTAPKVSSTYVHPLLQLRCNSSSLPVPHISRTLILLVPSTYLRQ